MSRLCGSITQGAANLGSVAGSDWLLQIRAIFVCRMQCCASSHGEMMVS